MSKNPLRHLVKADGRPISGLSSSAVASMHRSCKNIRRRTGWQGWYHRLLGTVQFHPGDRGMGGSVSDIVRAKGNQGRYLPIDEDRVCREICSTRMSRAKKDEILDRSARENKEALDAEIQNIAREMSPELKSITEFARRKANSIHSQRIFTMTPTKPTRRGTTLVGV